MGNFMKKQQRKLEDRQAGYDAIPVTRRSGFKRPGSLNPKKQGSGSGRSGRR